METLCKPLFSTTQMTYHHARFIYVELFRWRHKWLNADQDHLLSSAAQALDKCNHEFFPNVHKLLRILCTLPISSHCGNWNLRATMTSEQESALTLINIHYGRQIDIRAAINLFAPKHPRHPLLSDILAETTVNRSHNITQHLMKYVIC